MDTLHKNFIYQVNREENEDQQSLNTHQFPQQLTKTLQSENDQQSSIENDSNFYFRERMQHPFIIRISNQQQNQNQGDQSSSLKNFSSLLQVSQKKISRKISSETNKEDDPISIYQDSHQGGNTLDSFICNQNHQNQQKQNIDNNQNFFCDHEESNTNYISQIYDYPQQSNNIKRQKSFSIQKFNILQANQFDFKRKKKFSQDDIQCEQKDRTKIDHSQGINLFEIEQKSFKKRNNLLYMDYQTQKNIWRTKWIQITSLISKMKKIAHNSSLFFRPNELSDLQIRLIDDVSSNQISLKFSSFSKYKLGSILSYENLQNIISFKNYRKMVKLIIKYFGCFIKSYKNIKKIIKNQGIKVLNVLPLFHNLSYLYILWELIICISSSTLFIYIPFEYSFSLERNNLFDFYIKYYCQIIFGLDIFIKFNTKSTEQGTFTEQHLQIFSNYFKSSFIIDLFSLLSLNYKLFGLNFIQFFFFLRIFSSFRILEIIREQFLLKMKMFGIISLLYLLGQVIYFGHLFTCLWNYIGLLQLQQNQGWMIFYKFENESVTNRYIQIFYYATVTMTTIGYGDFTAQTQLEKLLMIFIAFFSCGIFGYTINSIGNILYDFKQKKDLYLQELAKINKYFKQNNVELGLQCRARKYIQYLYSDENSDKISSIKSLSNLSEYLQKEIQTDVYIKKLKKIKVFSEIFTDEILVELSLQMKEAFYCHDQVISQSEEENDQYLSFVNNGIILEYCQYQQNTVVKEIQEYREGQFFGLLAFLQRDNRRKVKYKSVGVSSILKLSYNNFVNVLKEHDFAFQKFRFILDEVKFCNKLMKINAYCNSCQQQNHVIEQCPYLFYEGKKQVILRNYFREQDSIFQNFRRQSTTKSQNALLNFNRVSSQADRYYISNIEFFSMWDLTDDSGYESNEDFKDLSKQNSSKKFIERQKTNQEGLIDKNISPSNKRESFLPTEQYKEISAQCLSEKKIIIQELEKNNNSQQFLERFSCEIPPELQGRYLSLIKKMDTLYRSQSHNYNTCQNQNCVFCKKQIELVYNLLEKNTTKQERNSKLSNPFKNLTVENKHKKSSIFCHKDKNETEFNQLHKQLSLNQQKMQKQNSFIDIHQKINEIEKLLIKNSVKQSIATFQQDQLFYYDFDSPANFTYYYPQGNAENIVKQINSIIQSKN
ncbi:hypothetical protein ABPG72_021345 [Tetrahymena utriculariae]